MEFHHGHYVFRIASQSTMLASYWNKARRFSAPALAEYLAAKAKLNPSFQSALDQFLPYEPEHMLGNPYPYPEPEKDYISALSFKLMGCGLYFHKPKDKHAFIPGTKSLLNDDFTPPWEAVGATVTESKSTQNANNDPVQQHMETMRRISNHNITSQPEALKKLVEGESPNTNKVTPEPPSAKNNSPALSMEGTSYIDPQAKAQFADPARKASVSEKGKVNITHGKKAGKTQTIILSDKAGTTETRDGHTLKRDENGFPVFNSKFDTVVSDDLLGNSDSGSHFEYSNRQLKKSLEKNPGLAKEMGLTPEQEAHFLKEPPYKSPPFGLTWHHHQDTGRMQLVNRAEHEAFVPHTGGMSIWGGGYKRKKAK